MSEPKRDRWLSIGMSVLLHGGLIALLVFGWWHFRHRPAPAPTLSIDATVVDARTLKGVGTASTPAIKPKPAPQAPPQEQTPPPTPAEGPPLPTPSEQAMRAQAAQEEARHEAQAQQELLARQQAQQAQEEAQRKEQAAAAAAAAQKAAQAKAAAQAKRQAQAKKLAEARKKAAAKLAAQKKLAEQRKRAQERKLAEEKRLAQQRAEAARAARVAELQRSLQEDEQAAAASGALASWQSEITSRIQNAWIKPPTAQPGIECVLNVSLVPGGSVTGVSIGQCNGDNAVRQSIQTAVYSASPLPPPPAGIPFPHQLIITFKPTN